MKTITQKMVKEVKDHYKKSWHDESWWKFEKLPTTTAIQAALCFCGKDASIKEVAKEANRTAIVLAK